MSANILNELDGEHPKPLEGKALLTDPESAAQSRLSFVMEALNEGIGRRVESWKENPGSLVGEVAGSAVASSALTLMLQAGGKWGSTAKVVGGFMLGAMGADIASRGHSIYDVYNSTDGLSADGLAARKDAIATYAGSAIADYGVMALAGGAAAFASRKFSGVPEFFGAADASKSWDAYLTKWGRPDEWRPGMKDWRPGVGDVPRSNIEIIPAPTSNAAKAFEWKAPEEWRPSRDWRPSERRLHGDN